jgi:hypothetical protein
MPRPGQGHADPARGTAEKGEAAGITAAAYVALGHISGRQSAREGNEKPSRLRSSRLPFRQKVCVDCGGKARITPAKPEQILKRP